MMFRVADVGDVIDNVNAVPCRRIVLEATHLLSPAEDIKAPVASGPTVFFAPVHGIEGRIEVVLPVVAIEKAHLALGHLYGVEVTITDYTTRLVRGQIVETPSLSYRPRPAGWC